MNNQTKRRRKAEIANKTPFFTGQQAIMELKVLGAGRPFVQILHDTDERRRVEVLPHVLAIALHIRLGEPVPVKQPELVLVDFHALRTHIDGAHEKSVVIFNFQAPRTVPTRADMCAPAPARMSSTPRRRATGISNCYHRVGRVMKC